MGKKIEHPILIKVLHQVAELQRLTIVHEYSPKKVFKELEILSDEWRKDLFQFE